RPKKVTVDHFQIWSVYQRETKRKAGTISWIGSYHNSTYYQQPHYRVPFTEGVHPNEKLAQALEWLKLDDDERPGLIMAYIVEPDKTGHSYSHMEDMVNEAVKLVDDAIGRFINNLEAEGILGCVNIVIVSDHGMTEIKNQVVLEKLFPIDNMVIAAGTNTLIFKNGSDLTDEQIMGALTCKATDLVRVFNRKTVPLRYHYSASKRIGDFIVVGNNGTQIYSRAEDVKPNHKGNHGFDYLPKDMHAIMFARGPSFKEKTVLPPFHIVEYMNLWTKLLQLSAQNNDGEPDFMNLALISGGGVQRNYHPSIRKCKMTDDLATKNLRTICGQCNEGDKEIFSKWAECSVGGASEAISITANTSIFCYMSGCNDMAVIDDTNENSYSATLVEMYEKDKTDVEMMSSSCTFHLTNQTQPCHRAAINETVEYRGLSAFSGRDILNTLNVYTMEIAQRFERMLVITGTAYDEDYDGVFSNSMPNSPYPTHLFRVHIACKDKWSTKGYYCENPEDTTALTFVFPHMNGDPNCLERNELLFQYIARIKDVETISGLIFNFTSLSDVQQMLLKTHIAMALW
ncbi:type I phosphodiesterase / nucleotide pyrophosphatase, partial [Oesophagostomum dentatum]